MGARNVVVKVGKQGALVCPAGGERMLLPTYRAIKPVDTTGAGDAFCAGFLTGLAQDWDYKRCGEFANAVGTTASWRSALLTASRAWRKFSISWTPMRSDSTYSVKGEALHDKRNL